MTVPAEKVCRSCGRRIARRKKWARDWDQIAYCSAGCRRHGVTEQDRELELTIHRLLASQPRAGLVADKDVARAVAPQDWPDLVEPARRAARRLTAAEEVELVQHGRVVDPSTARGSFSIRLRAAG